MNRYIALQKIVELGSFTKAADSLGYTQSALSQMIASLENELSIKLLNRLRTGAQLTPEGAELFPFIERTIFQYRSAQEKAKDILGLETGTVRIGAVSSISAHWLPQIIEEYHKKYPNVEFEIRQGDYTTIQEGIRTDAIDFGIINPDAAEGIQTAYLKDGALLAVIPKNHPLASLDAIQLSDLAKEPFIKLNMGHYSEAMESFRRAGLTPNVRYTVHDDYAIMSMVQSGLGVSILAELIFMNTDYDIVTKPILPPLTRRIAIGYKNKLNLPMASKRFIETLMNHLNELP